MAWEVNDESTKTIVVENPYRAGKDFYESEAKPALDAKTIATLRQKWGKKYDSNGKASEYSEDELQDLEASYNSQALEYKGAISPRIDMALQEISINRLEWKRAIGLGDSSAAKRFSDNIKSVMDREGMKANDEKPLESIRIDGVIHALERNGAAFDGTLKSSAELLELISDVRGEYTTSIDVVDEMIFAIINTMRKNNSQEEYSMLPTTAQVKDARGELKRQMSSKERKNMRELGLIPPQREK